MFLRFWGINFGLPHLHHPDEWAVAMPAFRILQTGDLNPHRFDYGSLHIYLLAGAYGLFSSVGQLGDFFPSIRHIPVFEPTHNVYAYDYPVVYVVGRAVSALLGSLTIVIVYLIAQRLLNRQAGFVAATFCAVFPLHVVNSHFIATDVPVTLSVALSFLSAIRTLDRGAYRDYALAGLLVGLTASIKYIGGTIIVVLVLAHILRRRRGFEGSKVLVGLLACAIGFAASTPFALLDYSAWRSWLEYVHRIYNPSGAVVTGSSARWYLGYLLRYPSVVLALPAIIGLIWTLHNRRREGWMMAAFVAVYYGFISAQKLHWPRALMPMLPFISVLAGLFVVMSAATIRRRWPFWRARARLLTAMLTLLLAFIPAQAAVGHAYRFTQKSARDLTREWVEVNLRPGTKIATDLAAPVLAPDRYDVNRVGWSVVVHDLHWYQNEGYEYLIVSESARNSVNRTVEIEAQYREFLGDSALTRVAEIKGHLLSYPDYHFWVYRIGK